MDKLKILIVEDDKILLALYDEFLVNDVFEKQLITNGKEGLEVYKSWKPDIIVLDIMLPLMSGYMVLKKYVMKFGTERPQSLWQPQNQINPMLLAVLVLAFRVILLNLLIQKKSLKGFWNATHKTSRNRLKPLRNYLKRVRSKESPHQNCGSHISEFHSSRMVALVMFGKIRLGR